MPTGTMLFASQAARQPYTMPGPLWWDFSTLEPSFGGGSLQRIQLLLKKLNEGRPITVAGLGSSVTEGHGGCWGMPQVPQQVEMLPTVRKGSRHSRHGILLRRGPGIGIMTPRALTSVPAAEAMWPTCTEPCSAVSHIMRLLLSSFPTTHRHTSTAPAPSMWVGQCRAGQGMGERACHSTPHSLHPPSVRMEGV